MRRKYKGGGGIDRRERRRAPAEATAPRRQRMAEAPDGPRPPLMASTARTSLGAILAAAGVAAGGRGYSGTADYWLAR